MTSLTNVLQPRDGYKFDEYNIYRVRLTRSMTVSAGCSAKDRTFGDLEPSHLYDGACGGQEGSLGECSSSTIPKDVNKQSNNSKLATKIRRQQKNTGKCELSLRNTHQAILCNPDNFAKRVGKRKTKKKLNNLTYFTNKIDKPKGSLTRSLSMSSLDEPQNCYVKHNNEEGSTIKGKSKYLWGGTETYKKPKYLLTRSSSLSLSDRDNKNEKHIETKISMRNRKEKPCNYCNKPNAHKQLKHSLTSTSLPSLDVPGNSYVKHNNDEGSTKRRKRSKNVCGGINSYIKSKRCLTRSCDTNRTDKYNEAKSSTHRRTRSQTSSSRSNANTYKKSKRWITRSSSLSSEGSTRKRRKLSTNVCDGTNQHKKSKSSLSRSSLLPLNGNDKNINVAGFARKRQKHSQGFRNVNNTQTKLKHSLTGIGSPVALSDIIGTEKRKEVKVSTNRSTRIQSSSSGNNTQTCKKSKRLLSKNLSLSSNDFANNEDSFIRMRTRNRPSNSCSYQYSKCLPPKRSSVSSIEVSGNTLGFTTRRTRSQSNISYNKTKNAATESTGSLLQPNGSERRLRYITNGPITRSKTKKSNEVCKETGNNIKLKRLVMKRTSLPLKVSDMKSKRSCKTTTSNTPCVSNEVISFKRNLPKCTYYKKNCCPVDMNSDRPNTTTTRTKEKRIIVKYSLLFNTRSRSRTLTRQYAKNIKKIPVMYSKAERTGKNKKLAITNCAPDGKKTRNHLKRVNNLPVSKRGKKVPITLKKNIEVIYPNTPEIPKEDWEVSTFLYKNSVGNNAAALVPSVYEKVSYDNQRLIEKNEMIASIEYVLNEIVSKGCIDADAKEVIVYDLTNTFYYPGIYVSKNHYFEIKKIMKALPGYARNIWCTFNLYKHFDALSTNLVFKVECKKCCMIYMGMTSVTVKDALENLMKRCNRHRVRPSSCCLPTDWSSHDYNWNAYQIVATATDTELLPYRYEIEKQKLIVQGYRVFDHNKEVIISLEWNTIWRMAFTQQEYLCYYWWECKRPFLLKKIEETENEEKLQSKSSDNTQNVKDKFFRVLVLVKDKNDTPNYGQYNDCNNRNSLQNDQYDAPHYDENEVFNTSNFHQNDQYDEANNDHHNDCDNSNAIQNDQYDEPNNGQYNDCDNRNSLQNDQCDASNNGQLEVFNTSNLHKNDQYDEPNSGQYNDCDNSNALQNDPYDEPNYGQHKVVNTSNFHRNDQYVLNNNQNEVWNTNTSDQNDQNHYAPDSCPNEQNCITSPQINNDQYGAANYNYHSGATSISPNNLYHSTNYSLIGHNDGTDSFTNARHAAAAYYENLRFGPHPYYHIYPPNVYQHGFALGTFPNPFIVYQQQDFQEQQYYQQTEEEHNLPDDNYNEA